MTNSQAVISAYEHVSQKYEETKADAQKLKGRLEQLLEQLKELGYDNLDDARAALEEQKKELEIVIDDIAKEVKKADELFGKLED